MATLGTAPIGPKAIARTYSPPGYEDPWDCVKDYLRVTEYADSHPDTGSSAMSSTLSLPRGRIRSWIEGSKPDALRAIEVAEENGWLAPETGAPVFRGLNVLVAWILSGGSISRDGSVPYFVANDRRDSDLLRKAASVIGVEIETTRSREQGRARELRPFENASVLGRILIVLGAPLGEKNRRSDIALPPYLESAPRKSRQEFAAIYLRNRANPLSSGRIRFREERSRTSLESLAKFLREIAGHEVKVSERNIYLSHEATASARSWLVPLRNVQ